MSTYKYRWDFLSNVILQRNIKSFVEIGVADGRNLSHILSIIKDKDIQIYAIDPYSPYAEYNKDPNAKPDKISKNYQKFYNNVLTDPRITFIQEYSKEASNLFSKHSVDLVFIDANHAYFYVYEDISCWYPIVKTEGIISGHDYDWTGPCKAVNSFFRDTPNLECNNKVWFFYK